MVIHAQVYFTQVADRIKQWANPKIYRDVQNYMGIRSWLYV